MRRLAGLLAALLVTVPATGSATDVSGTITTQTWTKPNSPYRVTDTLRVPAGQTLTIEPGVDVLFDAEVPFILEGQLVAIGTETDSIRFLAGATWGWGGIRISGGDSTAIAYARISGGRATEIPCCYVPVGEGGAIRLSGLHTRLGAAHCVISGNFASRSGGGIAILDSARATLVHCTVADNELVQWYADNDYAGIRRLWGGGISVAYRAGLTAFGCIVSGNLAGYGGGIAVIEYGDARFDGSLITRNNAFDGGGVYSSNSHTVLERCAIARNAAKMEIDYSPDHFCDGGDGGGVYTDGSTTSLVNCVIAGNEARGWPQSSGWAQCFSRGGGGLYAAGPVSATNLVVWDNVWATWTWGAGWDEVPNGITDAGTYASVTYSNVQHDTTWSGAGNLNADPLFVDPANGDYGLQAISPCIDAGNPTSPLDPDGTRSDMGATYFPHGVSVRETARPVSFHLAQNFPNPFNPSTTVRFTLPEAGAVRLLIYDVNGRVVRTLVDAQLPAGAHQVVWDGRDATGRAAASGVYLYRLTSEQASLTKRLLLLR